MKKWVPLFAFILIASCSKPKDEIIAGKSIMMFIQSPKMKMGHDYATWMDDHVSQPGVPNYTELDSDIELDIDNDGVKDFLIHTNLDISLNGPTFYYGHCVVESINTIWSLKRDMSKSKIVQPFYCIDGPYFDYYGTYARLTYRTAEGCQQELCSAQANQDYFVPEFVGTGEEISSQGEWFSSNEMILKKKFYHRTTYEFNQTADTLIGTSIHKDYSCLNFPDFLELFIPISKMVEGSRYLGWIKVRLSGENTIEILETAIQRH